MVEKPNKEQPKIVTVSWTMGVDFDLMENHDDTEGAKVVGSVWVGCSENHWKRSTTIRIALLRCAILADLLCHGGS